MNELRLLNIALRRGMNAEVPSVSSMVLHFVFMRGGNVLQKEVENEFDLRRSTASQLLRRLEENGNGRTAKNLPSIPYGGSVSRIGAYPR